MGYHETLGVPPTASQEEIKKAYRRMAMKYHPDRNPGDEEAVEMFKKVQEAFEWLTDDKRQPHQTTQGYKQTYQTKPQPPKSRPNDWIRDAPPPTHDIWGDPIGPEKPRPKPKPRPAPRPMAKYDPAPPEVDLWAAMETKSEKYIKRYWKEYHRLKNAMAYEEPEKFWAALEEWVSKNK